MYLHKLQSSNETALLDATSPEGQITHDSNVTSPLTNRTLYLNNLGRQPVSPKLDLSDLYSEHNTVSTVTWLEAGFPSDIVLERNNVLHNYTADYVIDELHVYGGAQLAFVNPISPKDHLEIRLGTILGDKTGRMMIGFNQSLDIAQPNFPLCVDVFRGGDATLKGELVVSGVTFNIEGILHSAENVTIRDGG